MKLSRQQRNTRRPDTSGAQGFPAPSRVLRARLFDFFLLVCFVILIAAPANAANVRWHFVNTFTGQPDTNYFTVTKISSNVLSSGGVIERGLSQRVTPAADGNATNYYALGWYSAVNSRLGNGVVINVYDDTSTLYDYTNLLQSGFNTYAVTVFGTNPPPTGTEITNALGFLPLTPVQTTNFVNARDTATSNGLYVLINAATNSGITAETGTNIAAAQAKFATNNLGTAAYSAATAFQAAGALTNNDARDVYFETFTTRDILITNTIGLGAADINIQTGNAQFTDVSAEDIEATGRISSETGISTLGTFAGDGSTLTNLSFANGFSSTSKTAVTNAAITIALTASNNIAANTTNFVVGTSNALRTDRINSTNTLATYVLTTSNSITANTTNFVLGVLNSTSNTITANTTNFVLGVLNSTSNTITANSTNFVLGTSNALRTDRINSTNTLATYVLTTSNSITANTTNFVLGVLNSTSNTITANTTNFVVGTSNQLYAAIGSGGGFSGIPTLNGSGTNTTLYFANAVWGNSPLILPNTGTYTNNVIAGGLMNKMTSDASGAASDLVENTISGGRSNQIYVPSTPTTSVAVGNVIGGGKFNIVRGYDVTATTIGGGWSNIAHGPYNVIGGGYENRIGPAVGGIGAVYRSMIGGGQQNVIGGNSSTIAGGYQNSVTGDYSTVAGGFSNQATGSYSVAAGQQAIASHQGVSVWSDAQAGSFQSAISNSAIFRVQNGVGINTNNPSGNALKVIGNTASDTASFGGSTNTVAVVSNIYVGSAPLLLYSTNVIGVTNAGSLAANGSYRLVSSTHYTNDFTSAVITNNGSTWQIKSNTTILYSGSSPNNSAWTIQSGSSPAANSYFDAFLNGNGIEIRGIPIFTNLDAKIASAITSQSQTNATLIVAVMSTNTAATATNLVGQSELNIDRTRTPWTLKKFYADSTYFLLLSNAFSVSGGTMNGMTAYAPGGDPYGSGSGEYLRDWIWTAWACPQFYSGSDLSNHIMLHTLATNSTGMINDGTLASLYSFDSQFWYSHLLYLHYKKTANITCFTNFQSIASNAIRQVYVSNSLVYVTGTNGALDNSGAIGHETYNSCLRYMVYGELAEMCAAAGQHANASNYLAELPRIRASLMTNLWDSSYGLFLNTSDLITNHSVYGSAFAVVTEAAPPEISDIIAQVLIEGAPGGSNYTSKTLWRHGCIYNFPKNEISSGDLATGYQLGGIWPGFAGWAWEVVARKNPAKALELAAEFKSKTISGKPLWQYEWYGYDDTLIGADNYMWSASGPAMFGREWQLPESIPSMSSFVSNNLTGSFSGNGQSLTNLNATNITAGAISVSRLPTNYFGQLFGTNQNIIWPSATWQAVTNFNGFTTNGFGYTTATGILTNNNAGYYPVTYHLNWNGDEIGSDRIRTALFTNDVVYPWSIMQGYVLSADLIANYGAGQNTWSGLLYLPANTRLQIKTLNAIAHYTNINAAIVVGAP